MKTYTKVVALILICICTASTAFSQSLAFSEVILEDDIREITIFTNNTSIDLNDYDVFYTTNGTRPTPNNGELYKAPFPVDRTTRIMAVIYDGQTPLTGLVHSYNVAMESVLLGYSTQSLGLMHPLDKTLREIRAVAAGDGYTVVAAGPWDVRMYGLELSANAAFESLNPSNPDPINTPSTIDLAAGGAFALALRSNGTVVGWGDNSFGQANPPSLTQVVAIAAGGSHALALHANGSVSAWGLDWFDQAKVPGSVVNAIAIAAGEFFSAALLDDGTVHVWGNNESGVLNIPAGLNNVVQISAGADYMLALKADGSVVAWGVNLGGRTNIPSSLPPLVEVAAGEPAFVLAENGAVYQVANNSLTPFNHNEGVLRLYASSTHAIVLLKESFYVEPVLDFSLTLQVMDFNAANPFANPNPGFVRPLRIGTTELLDDIEQLKQFAPPPAPSGDNTLEAYIFANNQYFYTYYQLTTIDENRWTITANAEGWNRYYVFWDPSELDGVPGSFIARFEYVNGITTTVDLRRNDRIEVLNESSVEIIHLYEDDVVQNYNAGFQLISNPTLNVIEEPTSVFFPAQANSLFAYSGVYTDETSLDMQRGYWLRFTAPASVTFTPPLRAMHVPYGLKTGWNLIGAPGYPFAVNDIFDPYNIMVDGTVYGYDFGYNQVSVMQPGKGYWVQVIANGDEYYLILDATSGIGSAPKLRSIEPEGFTRISLMHNSLERTFYLDGSLAATPDVNPLSFDMPPMPPSEAFDARFTNNGTLTEAVRETIKVQSPGDVLTLKNTTVEGRQVLIRIHRTGEVAAESHTLNPGEEVTVSGAGIREIEVESVVLTSIDGAAAELPGEVSLRQNYPNPFNPTTSIAYALPQESMVTLRVFDMLGRTVAVLVSDIKPAGYHQVSFNARGLASGMYLYRLEAGNTVLSRQMMLVK